MNLFAHSVILWASFVDKERNAEREKSVQVGTMFVRKKGSTRNSTLRKPFLFSVCDCPFVYPGLHQIPSSNGFAWHLLILLSSSCVNRSISSAFDMILSHDNAII